MATMHSHFMRIICKVMRAKQNRIAIPAKTYVNESIGLKKLVLVSKDFAKSNPIVNGLSDASTMFVASPATDFRPLIMFHVQILQLLITDKKNPAANKTKQKFLIVSRMSEAPSDIFMPSQATSRTVHQ